LEGNEFGDLAQALRDGKLDELPITPAEKLLMGFVERITLNPSKVSDEMVQGLRDAGWTDAHIAETVYIAAFFNMMVRIADAFGCKPPAVADEGGVPRAIAG
jgi:alkylhydroperoxidase family enzyme